MTDRIPPDWQADKRVLFDVAILTEPAAPRRAVYRNPGERCREGVKAALASLRRDRERGG